MGQEPEFRHLTTKDGLSSHYVYSILKDSEGFMWFGTGNGLDRYDGYTIITYRNIPGDSTSLSDNVVLSIAEDDPGRLLIGTALGGINIFNKATEEFYPFHKIPGDSTGLSHNQINDIHIDHEGNVWLGTNNGLNLFHPGAGKFDVFRQQCPSEENRCNQIHSLFRDSRGTLWIGTNSGFRWNSPLGRQN
jgi:ligand-binding sensor domain-containing protein